MAGEGGMQDNYNVKNSVPAGEWPSGVAVSVSYEMPVKDDGAMLMKSAKAGLFQLIAPERTSALERMRYFAV
jgi:hypothetical protein